MRFFKKKKLSNFIFIWIISCTFYSYEFLLQISPSVIIKNLIHDLSINLTYFGILTSLYFYAYSFMQIPSAFFFDNLGIRKILILSTFLCGFSAFIFGITKSFLIMSCARLVMGIGSSFAIISVFYTASKIVPEFFNLSISISITIGMIGAVFAQDILSFLVNYIGWRKTMIFLGFIGFLLSFASYFIYDKTFIKKKKKNNLQDIKEIFFSFNNWIMSLYGALVFIPTSSFIGLWSVPYIEILYNINKSYAVCIASLGFFGWSISSLFYGIFGKYFYKKHQYLLITNILLLIDILIIIYIKIIYSSILLLCILFILFGILSSSMIVLFEYIKFFNKKEHEVKSLGFFNTINTLGAAFIQPLVGYLLDVQYYNTNTIIKYKKALVIFPICIILSILICLFFIKNKIYDYEKNLY